MAALEIERVPVLRDNYVWLAHEPESGETAVIDPAVAEPVLAAAARRGWTITQVWNTHWHPDHTGGNADVVAATGARVTGPKGEAARIPTLDRLVEEGDEVALGRLTARVLDTAAHTAGHVSYHLPDAKVAFVGDTLFAMGCGRLFEGDAAQMYAAMRKYEAMPDDTVVYCAHEYTLSNGRFALTAEPENEALRARVALVAAMRERGEPTVPTTIGEERATNPFLRAASVAQLAERRAAKDAM